MQAKAKSESWVALGVFTQPHGVSGRIKVKSFTDPADEFADYPVLTDESGTQVKLKITGHTQGLTIVEIEGVTRREQAELLRGKKIGVEREALPALDEGLFYTDDLTGMAVVTADGTAFGTVSAVVNYGASDILDIARPDGASELYAFTNATFPNVDASARRITIDPPVILSGKPDADE